MRPWRDGHDGPDGERLPLRAEVIAEFGLFTSTSCKPERTMGIALECACSPCGVWADFLAGGPTPPALGPARPRYEILTQEFVAALAAYLTGRLFPGELLLEVGAGDGRLARALCGALPAHLRLVATDSGARGLAPVEQMEQYTAQEAVVKLQPAVVLCSWMPLGEDWTAAFRASASVREYVVVGDPVVCGELWATWGRAPGWQEPGTPPYEVDGWHKVRLPDIVKQQLARTDSRWCPDAHSISESFRRSGTVPEARLPCSPQGLRASRASTPYSR